MASKIPVVFFGSGPVAADSLELLLKNFEVIAVITKPKPAHHRGDFPVIDVAESNKLPLYTVSNKKELSALIATKPFRTEVAILIDFGIIVSQDVIDYFPRGIINSHFSLLPEWRGADPITFAILSGQNQTGVSLMVLVEAMDEGPLISFGIQELTGTETTPVLTEKLVLLSDALLRDSVRDYLETGKVIDQMEVSAQVPGYPKEPTYSRKLTKDDGLLDFSKPADQLEREIRAYIEWPKSRTSLAGIDVVITSSSITDDRGEIGQFTIKDKHLLIHTASGSLRVDTLTPAGKGNMTAEAFIAGYKQRLTS